MNLIEKVSEVLVAYGQKDKCLFPQAEEALGIIENYFRTTALSRGWSMDEFYSWVEDNFKGDY